MAASGGLCGQSEEKGRRTVKCEPSAAAAAACHKRPKCNVQPRWYGFWNFKQNMQCFFWKRTKPVLFFIDKKTMIITKHKPRRHAARRTSTGFCRHFYLEREPPYERALQQGPAGQRRPCRTLYGDSDPGPERPVFWRIPLGGQHCGAEGGHLSSDDHDGLLPERGQQMASGRRGAPAHFAGAGLCAPLPAAGRLFRPRQLQLFFRPGHGFLHEAAAARVRISAPDRGGCAGGGRGGKRCVRAAAAAV